MSFMEKEVVEGRWYEVETDNGTEFIPSDLASLGLEVGDEVDEDNKDWLEMVEALRDYLEGKPSEITMIEGWGARLSAPGYLDCTDWCVFETEEEANAYLDETYGDDEIDPDDESDEEVP